MEYRRLGRTGRDVSVIGVGAWAIGADWGTVDDAGSHRANAAAADLGLLDDATMAGVREIYETRVKPLVHQRW